MKALTLWISRILLTSAAIVGTGCSLNPLGMSDAEWESLTPTQKLEARVMQETSNEAARARRAERAAQEAAEQARIEELRRSAPFGDVVQCTLTDAEGYFSKKKWQPAQPVSIEIHRSEEDRSLSVPRQNRSSTTTDLRINFDGLTVEVCSWYGRDCDVLVGTEAQFRRGIARHIDIKKTARGRLFCSFPRGW